MLLAVYWVGTALGFDQADRETGKFTHYTQATGYPVTSIYSFAEECQWQSWMGSYSGDGLIRLIRATRPCEVFEATACPVIYWARRSQRSRRRNVVRQSEWLDQLSSL